MPRHAIDKHIAPPASAAQIAQAVGVTEEDRRAVGEVLRRLGFLSDEKKRCVAGKISAHRLISRQ
jgi:hypothetical protein